MQIEIDLLKNIIKQQLNTADIDLTPIDKGVMSKVFAIKTDTKEYIFRYDNAAQSRYELEAWTIKEIHKLGVPTPKVVSTGTEEIDGENKLNYMIQEKLRGKALSDDQSVDISKVLKEAGIALNKIHTIKLPRFGHLTPDKTGVVRSWPEFMFFHFRSKNSDYLEEVSFLSSDELDKATYLINERLSNFNLKQGYMLHVDLSLDHIFSHNGSLESIIDFQNVGSGDPLYDIATFDFYNETRYPYNSYTRSLIDGYGLNVSKEVQEAITFYKLCLGIWKVTGRIQSKREETVPRVKELVKQYIKDLQ